MQKILALLFLLMTSPVYALNIVVSIPPLAGMVQPLLSDEDRLEVLLQPGVSPHGFQLHPSHMLSLEKADLIILLGNPVDVWAQKASQKYASKLIRMNDLPGIVHLATTAAMHGHEHKHEHEGQHESEPAMLTQNPHIWLSPDNAKMLIQAVSKRLQSLEPKRKREIGFKTKTILQDLSALDNRLQQQLNAVKTQPYVVLHNAYAYFEAHYGLNKPIAIQLNPSLKPSLKRILAIREVIQKNHIRCIFKEPQFPETRVTYVVKGLAVKIDSLDPLGSRHGQESYAHLLTQLANHFTRCLSAK